mgnify:CR=1 FL=1
MKQVLAAFARNTVFANIVLVLIFSAGGFAVKNMIRENFPEFSLDMITITVLYPGADPEEVEEGISRKIEEAIEGLEGVKLYTTRSSENASTTIIEVKEGYDVQEVLDEVRTNVNAISTFPGDAEKPIISEMILKDAVLLLYLSGRMPERRIKEWSERLRDELQQLPEVSSVDVFGSREYEIAIEVSEESLRRYNLTFEQVAAAVRRSNLNLAGGTIRGEDEEIRIRTMGRKYTGEALADIVVLAGRSGEMITLDKLATIRDGFAEDTISAFINGEDSVLLMVNKTQEQDALTISHAVTEFTRQRQQQLPAGINFGILYDNTEMLRARIDLLVKNGIIGLAIVFGILWAILNARLSFWVGLGIPVSVAGALAIVWALGGTINLISLFGFIMVLGIVVDDAIVVGEAIYLHRSMGKPPIRAAVDGICEVGMPVIAAVVTTIVAFIPLLYVGGIMGKFISILPVVVIACLAISLVECLILLPAHLSNLPDPNQPQRAPLLLRPFEALNRLTSRALVWFIERVYTPFLKKVLYWRYIALSIAIAVLMLTIGMVRGGILKFTVFPEIDGFIITATAEFPAGTPADVTAAALERIDQGLLRVAEKSDTISGEPLIESRLMLLGQTLEDIPRTGPNLGSVQTILLRSEFRGIHTDDLMVAWEKEIGAIPGIKSLTFAGLNAGPPGAPIEVWIQGYDMEQILAAVDDLMARLQRFDGVYQIRSDFSPGKKELRLKIKPEAHNLGLTVEDLARQVYAGFYGDEAVRLQRGRDDVRVKVRYAAEERKRISDLTEVRIRTAAGTQVPLVSVADIVPSEGYATITRTNGMRRVAVSADVDSNRANANEIFAELGANFFPELGQKYPELHVAMQGEKKKMRESMNSLFVGFPLAILGIFIIVATMFRSYVQPFVILFTVPFGIIGAVVGHLLLGFDLSMMSMFGMVALTGVVVNDAIVLIERINENIADGMGFIDAIISGGQRRFRAIVLTTVSTVGGLAPLIMEQDLQARFLIPMGISVAAGVTFATVLTLALIPSLLIILSDLRLCWHRLRHGAWVPRLMLEPARTRRLDPMVHDGRAVSAPLLSSDTSEQS